MYAFGAFVPPIVTVDVVDVVEPGEVVDGDAVFVVVVCPGKAFFCDLDETGSSDKLAGRKRVSKSFAFVFASLSFELELESGFSSSYQRNDTLIQHVPSAIETLSGVGNGRICGRLRNEGCTST